MADLSKDLGERLTSIERSLLLAISGDFSARNQVSDELDGVDAIATGVNILIEELEVRLEELEFARAAAEASNAAKRRFLANMSHEIRTPMNGVLGMTSLLMLTDVNPEQQEYVETIQQSGQTLLRLIDDILDFSKIEMGRVSLKPRPCNVAIMAEDVVLLLGERAERNHLRKKHWQLRGRTDGKRDAKHNHVQKVLRPWRTCVSEAHGR